MSIEGGELQALIRKALANDPASVRALVDMLSPVIERRVAAALWKTTSKRDVRQELGDMTQEVFLSLFREGGKALLAWDPARGSSLTTFVGLLAVRQVISILRCGRTSPWPDEPTDDEQLDALATTTLVPEEIIGSREHLRKLADRLREELSPLGLELFQRLIIDEEPLEEVCAKMQKTPEALYQWKSRLLRRSREISREILAGTGAETSDGPGLLKGSSQR